MILQLVKTLLRNQLLMNQKLDKFVLISLIKM